MKNNSSVNKLSPKEPENSAVGMMRASKELLAHMNEDRWLGRQHNTFKPNRSELGRQKRTW